MKEQSNLLKSIIMGMFIIALIICVGTLFIYQGVEFYLGILMGLITATLQVIHINRTLGEALYRTPNEAKKYVVKNYMLRSIVIIIVMVLGRMIHTLTLVGVVLGLFTLKISAYTTPLISKYNESRAKGNEVIK